MFARSAIPCAKATLRTAALPFKPRTAMLLPLRSASTAIPPTAHPRLRPSRVLMGVVAGGALIGGFAAYQYYTTPEPHDILRITHVPHPHVRFEELQKHNTRESCWLLINGHVYDATSVLKWHPAGADIILEQAGGKDATAAYLAVHKPELLTHLPPTAHLGPIDPTTLPPALAPELSEEEEIFRTAEAA